MGTQEMVIALKQGETFYPAKFRAILKEIDYTIRDIRIKATGEAFIRPEKRSTRFSGLEFKVLGQVFPILSATGEAKNQEEQQVTRAKLISELRAAVKAGKKKLTIIGKVLQTEDAAEGILLEQIIDS
ncbi:MAG: hypothetical protein O7G87_03145 [bacterium]|nr:hypothetical protein [bacterium]